MRQFVKKTTLHPLHKQDYDTQVCSSKQAKPKRGHSGRPTGKIVAIVTTASANVREKSI
jgi:hypothetical protein